MSFSTTFSLQYCFRGTPINDQILEVRFRYCSRLIVSDQILQQTPSTLIEEALFSLYNLQNLPQQQAIEFLVDEFLRSFNFHSSVCQIISQEILSFSLQFDTNNGSFKIEANIDYMEDLIWNTEVVPISVIGEEGFEIVFEEPPSPERRSVAPDSAIERLRKQKFEGGEEEEKDMGDCSVCCEDLKKKGTEMSRIPCGHVYHKSCILTWLQMRNSCPLCRAALQ